MIYKCQICSMKPLTAWVILKWSLYRKCWTSIYKQQVFEIFICGIFWTICAFPLYVYWIFVNESPTVEWYFFPNDFTLSWHAPSGAPACSPCYIYAELYCTTGHSFFGDRMLWPKSPLLTDSFATSLSMDKICRFVLYLAAFGCCFILWEVTSSYTHACTQI